MKLKDLRHNKLAWLSIAGCLCVLAIAGWWVWEYALWRRQLARSGFAGELDLPDDSDRILIVAPHPDDELLGCGGLISRALAAGAEVRVVVMTNGDGAPLALIFGQKDLPLGPAAYLKLGRKRQQETLAAMQTLGLPPDHVYFLSYPNMGLLALWKPEHWSADTPYTSPYTHADRSPYANTYTPRAIYCGEQVTRDLIKLLDEFRPTAIFVTHPQDVHPDHWATERFVEFALRRLQADGKPWASRIALYGYLIHWPRWPLPLAYAPRQELVPPPDLLAADPRPWLKLPLDSGIVKAETQALWCYHSQQPRVDRLLPALIRANEAFAALNNMEASPSLFCPLVSGRWIHWQDERTLIHRIDGADVTAVYIAVAQDNRMLANLLCHPHTLGRNSYAALDVRCWDANEEPVIATVYLTHNSPARVVCLRAGKLITMAAPAEETSPGLWTVGPVRLPEIRAATAMLSCWGSVQDRLTDPAHWPGMVSESSQLPEVSFQGAYPPTEPAQAPNPHLQ